MRKNMTNLSRSRLQASLAMLQPAGEVKGSVRRLATTRASDVAFSNVPSRSVVESSSASEAMAQTGASIVIGDEVQRSMSRRSGGETDNVLPVLQAHVLNSQSGVSCADYNTADADTDDTDDAKDTDADDLEELKHRNLALLGSPLCNCGMARCDFRKAKCAWCLFFDTF